ncbi:glycerol-3-phosphate dehydrogenase (NAD(P)+) [Quisquiliibacterium transsilvanicum]|uniref:Glycerol-3-phosphate dehydrogenase [NAD(P)+] n=2 Tax=Quisquiliibacterium transsilvanicum TaxID=1549638 RepID=A0A7W8MAI1_9BURK|nr:glycerol-3-phosphate dehydrogenase (NAD(P)+) [Quisquiliibacterium transsilvanicum]
MSAVSSMRVAILGAGAWGTAVAVHAAARHQVMLWTRDPAHAVAMREARRNARYLPEARLPDAVEPVHELGAALRWVRDGAEGGLVVLATSVAGLRPTARALAGLAGAGADARTPVIWLCKGLERDSGLLPHQVVTAEAPGLACGVLSGPSFAQEVAAGLPVALTVASDDERVCRVSVEALHHSAARIYRSDDVVGVEIGGALKNVMAIAAGICDGLSLGQNARAALITRGLAEIGRFGIALGAQPETFHGLTGLGDLVLTCTGDLSRNRRVGLGLAAGKPLAQVVGELGHVAEGVACAHVVHRRAGELGVDVPIVSAVHAVLEGELDAREAVLSLLSRGPKREN